MAPQTRQFNFAMHGLQVFCTATFYPDGAFRDVAIDYVMEGLIDWWVYISYTNSPIIRLIRMKFLHRARQRAAEIIQQTLTSAYDVAEFQFD